MNVPDILVWHATFHFERPEDREYRLRIYPAREGRYLLRLLGGTVNMAVKNGRNSNGFQTVEFVTINLDAQSEKEFRAYAKENAEKLVPLLSDFMADQHKIGLTWDDGNVCFIASATCKAEKSENYNQCITARSDDWSESLLLLIFKANVLAKGGTWATISRPMTWG